MPQHVCRHARGFGIPAYSGTTRNRLRRNLFVVVLLAACAMLWASRWGRTSEPAAPPHEHAGEQTSAQQDSSMPGMNMPMQQSNGVVSVAIAA